MRDLDLLRGAEKLFAVQAATAAGAPSILVPTPRTRFGEILDAPVVAPDLLGAAAVVLEGRLRPPTAWSEP